MKHLNFILFTVQIRKVVIIILPLDKPTAEVIELLKNKGYVASENGEELDAALRLDLNIFGDFGEVWLLLDLKNKRLHRVRLSDKDHTVFDTSLLSDTYVDSYTTSNRILSYESCDNGEKKTVVLGSCTNACKCKLLAFVTIWERLSSGISVNDDDPIFDQFNAKCPKCGSKGFFERKR